MTHVYLLLDQANRQWRIGKGRKLSKSLQPSRILPLAKISFCGVEHDLASLLSKPLSGFCRRKPADWSRLWSRCYRQYYGKVEIGQEVSPVGSLSFIIAARDETGTIMTVALVSKMHLGS